MSEPYCLALVLCDAVHRDPATQKATILGTFSTVTASKYPTRLRLCIYSAITDATGHFKLKYRLVDSTHVFNTDSEPVFSVEHDLESPSPLAVCEGIVTVNSAQIPKPGVYHCELLCKDEILMSRRLIAVELKTEQTEENDA